MPVAAWEDGYPFPSGQQWSRIIPTVWPVVGTATELGLVDPEKMGAERLHLHACGSPRGAGRVARAILGLVAARKAQDISQ